MGSMPLSHAPRDLSRALPHRDRKGLAPVAADSRHWPGDADRRGDLSTFVEDRRRYANRAQIGLLVIQGIALLRDARELPSQAGKV